MTEKITKLLLIALMALGVFGLTACNAQSLSEQKIESKARIETFARERKDNYCDENWQVVISIVEKSKIAIDEAKNHKEVDVAVDVAIIAINAVEEDAMRTKIRTDYLEKLNNSNLGLEDIYIFKFYGVYNDGYAVIMAVHGIDPPPSIDEIIIEDFNFLFNTGRHILIWRDGEFFDIKDAFDKKLLTLESVAKINDLSQHYKQKKYK